MSDGDALLAAIRANPADDTPRLVYADWLQENGRADRAEFVRRQTRLLRMSGDPALDDERDEVRTWLMRSIDNGDPALWVAEDFGLAPFDWHWSGDEMRTEIHTAQGVYVVARGFVAEVRLTLAEFVAHARALFAAHPIEAVTLTDREPTRSIPPRQPDRYLWVRNDNTLTLDRGTLRDELPPVLFDRLRVACHRDAHITSRPGDWCQYPTEGLAAAALSAAAVSLGRHLAEAVAT